MFYIVKPLDYTEKEKKRDERGGALSHYKIVADMEPRLVTRTIVTL
jgi:hypothetical protein